MVFGFRLERPLGHLRDKMLIGCVVIRDGFLTFKAKASFQHLYKADTHTLYIIITIHTHTHTITLDSLIMVQENYITVL